MKEALGTIQVDNEVIAKVAGSVAVATSGIVGMAMLNIKSGIWEILKKEKNCKKHKAVIDMVDSHLTVSIVNLNVNDLKV